MNTKRYLALVMALVMAFSLVVPVSAEAPTSVGVLTHSGTDKHDTARLTVYVNADEAAVGSIDSDMNAKLVLNYHNYSGNSTVTVAGQTESHANLTTFTLNGSSNSGIDLTTVGNIYTYFPGLNRLNEPNGYAIKFVDELGESSQNWDYTFKKSADTNGVTLKVVPDDASEVADARWQALKKEAFDETHDHDENSFIKLAVGSYLQMANEKLTVVNSDLLLDDFSNADSVDANVTNAYNKLEYSGSESVYAYQLLLKAGTQFSLGCSRATVKQDLLVTMSNVTKSYDKSILNNVYSNLNTSKEKQLAESLLEVFSEIAGLARPGDTTKPVVITFGRPATEDATSDPVEVNNGDGTTTTTSTAIAVDTTGETTTYNIKTTTTTTTTVSNESTTTTTTKPVTVETDTAATYSEEIGATVASNSAAADAVAAVIAYNTNTTESATFKAALASNETATAPKVLQTTAAAKAIATAAATLTPEQTGAVTEAKVILQTKLTAVAQDNNNKVTSVTYDITPVAQLYNNETPVGNAVELKNEDIEAGQTFTFSIPVPSTMTANQIKVTHDGEFLGTFTPTGSSDDVRYVTVTVSHFSEFELEPISAGSSSELTYLKSLSLTSEIAVNFYIGGVTNTDGYSVEYFKTVDGQAGESVTKPFAELDKKVGSDTKTYYYVKLAEFAARQMTDTVTVRVWNGDYKEFEAIYSIQSYCNEVIGGSKYTAKHKNVCKAILDYGKYSQLYFDYKTDTLANSHVGGDDYFELLDVPETFAGINEGSAGVIVSLSLKSQVVMNIYVPETKTIQSVSVPEGLSYTNNGLVTSNKGAKYTHIQVTGYVARSLDDTVTVTVDGYNYIWSPLGYSRDVQDNSNVKLANVSRAVYNYYLKAVEYFS